jgi:hypothetical protein
VIRVARNVGFLVAPTINVANGQEPPEVTARGSDASAALTLVELFSAKNRKAALARIPLLSHLLLDW